MAKQTFTTGQVLTAAQMTSLQQTAMGGGSTTAKTTSYVLVAADAGTVVQMNSASATTITVNTALFATGDTVQIQNVGAGVCTVTAGTATVSTSATLALKQYDAGSLYFNTSSAAIFFAVDAADGMANVLTTTGDIIYSSSGTTAARLGIGTTGQVLTVAGGVPSWATPAAGGGMTLLSTTTMSGATTTVSSISQSYKNLYIEINSMSVTAFNPTINYLTNAAAVIIYGQQAAAATGVNYYSTAGTLGNAQNYANLSTNNKANWTIFDYTDAANNKPSFFNQRWINEGGSPIYFQGGMATSHTAAVTSISMTVSTGTFNGGSIKIYGVN